MAMHYTPSVNNADLSEAAGRFGAAFDGLAAGARFSNDRTPERKLRVGYVSGDFRSHPVGYFLIRVLSAHRPEVVERFCYSNGPYVDAMTERLRASCDHWRDISAFSDRDAAELIRRDGVDILIDLSGHTSRNRLPLFALKPAPVQASWIGYFGTTGLGAMDYLLLDAISAPEGADRWYREKLVRLPYGRFCYEAPDYAPEPAGPPCLQNGYVTFGSFNNVMKLNGDVIALWARLLRDVPDSAPPAQVDNPGSCGGAQADSRRFRRRGRGLRPDRIPWRVAASRHAGGIWRHRHCA